MTQTAMLIENKYVLGSRSSVVDNRRKWEDRVFVGEIVRNDGTKFIVGVVADGVGSADYGSRGAQLAIDKAVEFIQSGPGDNIPLLIKNSIEYANTAVFQENQTNNGDGLTTLVVSIIHNDRLFIGNVGDSRAYWVQTTSSNTKNGKILQLTRDHSYYNIYGGDPNEEQAGALVNSIGNNETVQVDLGFYLKGPDVEKAYQLGLLGLPLKPGDTVLLCSDGLIKNDPSGARYATDEEIVDSIQTEFEPDKAVIKMVSRAEGRMPDDNVSAVTIQYLSPELVKLAKTRSAAAQRNKTLVRTLIGVGGAALLVVVAFLVAGIIRQTALVVELQNQPTSTPILIMSTPLPTLMPIQIGHAIVDKVYGSDANITAGQEITSGTSINSGTGLVAMRVHELNDKDGFIFLFPASSAQIVFGDQMTPILNSGAVYIQPASSLGATVDLSNIVSGLSASVSGSRMIVQVKDGEIWIFCFEGKCLINPPGDANPIRVPTGSKMVYYISTQTTGDAEGMTYIETWNWNIECEYLCFEGFLPTPTVVITENSMSITPTDGGKAYKTPTPINCDDNDPRTNDTLGGDGKCVHTLKTCNDNDPKTNDTLGDNGECVYTLKTCDDHDPKTTDTLGDDGQCIYTLKTCNDNDPKTIDTLNDNGECIYTLKNCDDHDPKTIDTLNDNGECVYTPKNCDDHDPKTIDSVGEDGTCVHTLKDCDDGDPNTKDTLSEDGTCVHTPIEG